MLNHRMHRTLRVLSAVTLGAVAATLHASLPADAYQTTWTRYNASCATDSLAGYLNFCRNWNTNNAMARDSDLRSTSGGVHQDKYLDGYIVGTTAGNSPNTEWVRNNFTGSGPSVSFYRSTACSGLLVTLLPGGAETYFPSILGFMSFAGSGASC